MHEAEKILDVANDHDTDYEQRYCFYLASILEVHTGKDSHRMTRASAVKKAEALLRTYNLWK